MESRFVWFGVVSRQTLVRWRKASGATQELCPDSDHFERQESENPPRRDFYAPGSTRFRQRVAGLS